MRRIGIVIAFIFLGIAGGYAQEMKVVSATYTYMASEDVAPAQAKRTAIERAKIQAMAEAFGTIVSQFNSTRVENTEGKSSVAFLSLGGSEVKGEWIETIEELADVSGFEQNMLVVTATVKGRAREIVSAGVDFKAKILRNGTEEKFEDYDFRNGDDLYLSFTSPVKGYLAVYLIDAEQQAYCLLPYRHQTDGIYKIEANRPYLFFNASAATAAERALTDEYVMTCNRTSEQNLVCLVFSPNPFAKAIDTVTEETLPRHLSYDDFQRWLVKCRKRDKDMTLKQYMISIAR